MKYYVYILVCADQTLYIGWTTNLDKRLHAHNNLPTGAKYTHHRRPVTLGYSETFATRSEAMKRECALKQLTRAEKLLLIQ